MPRMYARANSIQTEPLSILVVVPIILDILSCLFSAPLSLYYTPQGNAVVDVLCKVNDPVVVRTFIISSLQQLSASRL